MLKKCNRHVAASEVKPPTEPGSEKKRSVGASKKLWVGQNSKESTMGVGMHIAIFVKTPGGSKPVLSH